MVERDLAAGQELERDLRLGQGGAQLRDEPLHLLRRGRPVGAHVRGRGEGRDPVLDRRAGHLERGLETVGPVVDTGEDVGVQIDHERPA